MSVSIDTAMKTAQTLFEAFRAVAETCPSQIAFRAEGGRGRTYTYAEVVNLVERLSRGLLAGHYERCDLVGLLSENRPEWAIAYLTITAAGKTVVPIDINLKPSEIAFIIKHGNLAAAFVSESFEQALKSEYPDLALFSFDEKSPYDWLRLIDDENIDRKAPEAPVAALIYTSGTTGDPKAVKLTHRNLLSNIEGIKPSLPFSGEDVFLSILPLHHTFEATCGFLTPLMSGSSIVYARSMKSKEIREDIEANNITVMCGVPLLYEKLYHSVLRKIQSASWPQRMVFRMLYWISAIGWSLGFKWGKGLFRGLRSKGGMASMRIFVSGGAALPPQISRFFNLIGLDLLQGYGMTECSPVVSVNRPDDTKFGSVGPPLANLEVRIEQPDSSGVGEILIKGDSVTPGYRGDKGRTAELIRDGWLYSGDLGKLEKGHLWITGRKKNIIISAAGKNIYPEQIEEKLLDSPYILESVVFGRAKAKKQGEEVCAVIVPDREQFALRLAISAGEITIEQILPIMKEEVNRINSQMAEYKRISNFEIQFEELQKTSTKKVKRFVYR